MRRALLNLPLPLWWNNRTCSRDHLPPNPTVEAPGELPRGGLRAPRPGVPPRGPAACNAHLRPNCVSPVSHQLSATCWCDAAWDLLLKSDGRIPKAGSRAVAGRARTDRKEFGCTRRGGWNWDSAALSTSWGQGFSRVKVRTLQSALSITWQGFSCFKFVFNCIT